MRHALIALLLASTALAQARVVVLYEYDDGSGPTQVENLSDVPKKYRAKAKKVEANLVEGAGRREAPRARGSGGNSPRFDSTPPQDRPGAQSHVSCTFRASVRPNVTSCRNDGDCQGACVNGACVKGGTRAGYTTAEVGGKQWEGSYSRSGDLQTVQRECDKYAREKSSEEVSCSCSVDR